MAMTKWKLYWLTSPYAYENCFVIAKNSRSARSVEYRCSGMDFDCIDAKLIVSIPEDIEKKVQSIYRNKQNLHWPWPGFVSNWIINELGGSLNQRNGRLSYEIAGKRIPVATRAKYFRTKQKPVARSLDDIETFVRGLPGGYWIFRGQSNAVWDTVSKINRTAIKYFFTDRQIRKYETRVFEEFKERARRHLSVFPKNDWEWLTLGQHHGLPTRILDWTFDPLVATFFATFDSLMERDAELIAFNFEDFPIDAETINPFEIDRIRVFHPPQIVDRVKLQQSVFTVEPVPLRDGTNGSIESISIPMSSICRIKDQLLKMDISQGSLLPTLDSIALEVAEKFAPKK